MNQNGKSLFKIIYPVLVFFVGCMVMYGVVYRFPNLFSKTILEKNVTVTDLGIADSVEKVYDAVVIVSTYKGDALYATGTGFVYKKDDKIAYLLTNNHVISEGNKITVTFTDGKVVEADVVGNDLLSDIAVLSVADKEIISVAELGSSNDLRVGDTAFTVGAPLDNAYSWTVTRGIISGKDRMVEVELSSTSGDYVMKVLQTDAAINSGNSGGPLCNANGEVVGITSLKLINESIEGMGFAIPIETAIEYAEKLINGEEITQPYMGISMVNVADAYYNIQYYTMLSKYNITSGVVILSVEKDSAAYKAGLEEGDVIIKVNDDSVKSIGYFRYYLYNYEPGDKVKITYIRDGKEKVTTVTLGTNKNLY